MKKAMDALAPEVKSAAVVLFVLDARCPLSSFNPKLREMFARKKIIFLLNKSDLASVKISKEWLKYFKDNGEEALLVSCRDNTGRKKLLNLIDHYYKEHTNQPNQRRRRFIFRMVVVGVPNVGKSSIINMLSPGASARTGKKPGITRGKQWLKIKTGVEVLDSPGIMPPRTDLPDSPWILGTIAVIKQEILPLEEVTRKLLRFLYKNHLLPEILQPQESDSDEIKKDESEGNSLEPGVGEDRIEPLPEKEKKGIDPDALVAQFARKRGFLQKGGEIDFQKAALHILKELREGKFGRISLERPPLTRS